MAANLGAINVVFVADVGSAIARLDALGNRLDAVIARATSQTAAFSKTMASFSSGIASSITASVGAAGKFTASVAASVARLPVGVGNAASQIAAQGRTMTASFGASANSLGRSLDETNRKTRDFASSFYILSTAISALSLKALIDSVGEYDRQLEAVRVLTRETSIEFKKTREAVLALADSLQVSSVDVAKGLNEIVQSGFSASEALKILEASTKGAKVGMTTAEIASKAMIQTLNAFKISADDSEQVIGRLVRAVDIGVFSFERLAQNIGQAAPLASAMGVKLTELLALFTAMTRKEANLDEVTTQIRASFSDMIAPSDRARAAMERLLGTTLEASIRSRGFADSLHILVDGAKGSSVALAEMFPNVRAISGLSKLAGENFSEFTRDIKRLDAAGVGSLNRALAIQTKSFGTLVAQIKATAANSLVRYFEQNREAFISYADAVNTFVKDNPAFLVQIAGAATALAALALAIAGTRLAVAGLTLGFGALSSVAGVIRSIFNTQSVASVGSFADKIEILSARLNTFVSGVRTESTVVRAAIDARNAAAFSMQQLASATQRSASANAAFDAALANSTALSNRATEASRAMTAARIAEREAEDALILARQRQVVAENRVAGLNLAASNRTPSGRLKAASPGAKNLLPSAVSDLVSANDALAASELRLANAELVRQAAVARVASATTAATVAQAELAVAAEVTTETTANLAAAQLAAANAANAEAAAMGRLTAALGSVEAAEAAVATTTTTSAAAGTGFVAAIRTMLSAARGAAAGLGAVALSIGAFGLKVAAVVGIFLSLGYAIGKVIDKILELLGLVDQTTDKNGNKLDRVSDKTLHMIELQKRFYAEANRDAFARKMSENAKSASDVIEKLQNMADLARAAAAGSDEAAVKLRRLSDEFKTQYGQSGFGRIIDDLYATKKAATNAVIAAINTANDNSKDYLTNLVRIDEKTGEVIGTTANLKTLLVEVYGEDRGLQVVKDLEDTKIKLEEVRVAQEAYNDAVSKLKKNQTSLQDVLRESNKYVDEHAAKLKKLSDQIIEGGLSSSQKETKNLNDQKNELLEINKAIELREDLIRKAYEVGKKTPQETRDANEAVLRLREIGKISTDTITEIERQKTKIVNEEIQRRLEDRVKADDRVRELDIEAKRKAGDIIGADKDAAQLALDKQIDEINKTADARVKAVKESVSLTDAQRKHEIDLINEQADAEYAASVRARDAKLIDADHDEAERQKHTDAFKKQTVLKEAADLKEKIRQAEINGLIDTRNDLVSQYVKKLEEAGLIEEAQLVREREMNRNARDRIKLLQQEIQDRLAAGQGTAGVTAAARAAESALVGSTDVGTFRGSARGKLDEFNSSREAHKFVDAVTGALKTEYDSLEVQRREAIRRNDIETAKEIAQQQKEVIVRFKVLLDELARRDRELRGTPVRPPSTNAIVNRKTTGTTTYPTSPLYGAPEEPYPTSPLYGAPEASPSTPDATGGNVGALPAAVGGLTNTLGSLSTAVESASRATLATISATSAKLIHTVGVLNNHTEVLNDIGNEIQKLRLVSMNAG